MKKYTKFYVPRSLTAVDQVNVIVKVKVVVMVRVPPLMGNDSRIVST